MGCPQMERPVDIRTIHSASMAVLPTPGAPAISVTVPKGITEGIGSGKRGAAERAKGAEEVSEDSGVAESLATGTNGSAEAPGVRLDMQDPWRGSQGDP